MSKKLSIIIPSLKREKLLENSIENIIEIFDSFNFQDYNIIAIVSGFSGDKIKEKNEKVLIHYENEHLSPGIARNIAIEKSDSEWVWFIDDDDEIFPERIPDLIDFFYDRQKNHECDLIAHSLKNKYDSSSIKNDLLKNVCLFKEKQEVFNYIFKRKIIKDNNILFSDGLHEDIRYVAELLSYSHSIKLFDFLLYKKITREDSITKSLNFSRIDGYLLGIQEIQKIKSEILERISNDIYVQCLGTILYLINKSENKLDLIDYLDRKINEDFRSKITEIYGEKSTNFKYAVSLYLNKSNNLSFVKELDYCFSSYLSCRDLKNSIFLGPKEIIGCCKRFFYKGKMKGDIVLMSESSDVNLKNIIKRKSEVEEGINSETYDPCEGCPYIERYSREDHNKINYISLENFTYCNMRCTYCSPKYYGGKEAVYDTHDIISELIDGNYLGDKVHVVWGGGEPTLQKQFKEITENLIGIDNVYKIRILSNSLRFSKDLYDLASNEKIRIVTSIDAGTQDVFKKIRGRGEILTVLQNLKTYTEKIKDPENLTLKYILTEQNYHSDELAEFVNLLKEFGFENNFVQISCNFLYDRLDDELIFSIYELASRLLREGFKFVYFDDLIRDRLSIEKDTADKVMEYLSKRNLLHENILYYGSDKKVVLWGDGYQSKWIKNNTTFGKSDKIVGIVSNKNEISELQICEEVIIVPAAIQQLTDIFKEIKKETSVYENLKFSIFL